MLRDRHTVTLTAEERDRLVRLVTANASPAFTQTRAFVLLKADARPNGPGWTDERIADAYLVSVRTVARIRLRYTRSGLDAALVRKPLAQPTRPSPISHERLREVAEQSPRAFGKNRSTWTLQLLADVCVEAGVTSHKVSGEAVRRALRRSGVKWRNAELWMNSPDPHYAEKKARRDRYLAMAAKHPDWVVGFADEVWWSRFARPPLRGWSSGPPLRLQVLPRPANDPDPVALCCYGLLRTDTDRMMLRFVEGRPDGEASTEFLAWVCEQLREEGKTRLVVIWDDASWHAGGGVLAWVGSHNKRVRRSGGVHVTLCPLPVRSPWLNTIETKWGPAKRSILEPDRIPTAAEITTRVCDHFGVPLLPCLPRNPCRPDDQRE